MCVCVCVCVCVWRAHVPTMFPVRHVVIFLILLIIVILLIIFCTTRMHKSWGPYRPSDLIFKATPNIFSITSATSTSHTNHMHCAESTTLKDSHTSLEKCGSSVWNLFYGNLFGVQKLEVAHRFLENVCIAAIIKKSFCKISKNGFKLVMLKILHHT